MDPAVVAAVVVEVVPAAAVEDVAAAVASRKMPTSCPSELTSSEKRSGPCSR